MDNKTVTVQWGERKYFLSPAAEFAATNEKIS